MPLTQLVLGERADACDMDITCSVSTSDGNQGLRLGDRLAGPPGGVGRKSRVFFPPSAG